MAELDVQLVGGAGDLEHEVKVFILAATVVTQVQNGSVGQLLWLAEALLLLLLLEILLLMPVLVLLGNGGQSCLLLMILLLFLLCGLGGCSNVRGYDALQDLL